MSGDGLISVRFPRSLLELFRAQASRSRRSLHDAARFLISHLGDIAPGELVLIEDPPPEGDDPRVSLYVGQRWTQALAEISQKTHLSVSSVIRRLTHGLFVTGSLKFVQQNNQWRLVSLPNGARNNGSQNNSGVGQCG